MGEWRYSSIILNFDTRRMWLVNFTPLPLYPQVPPYRTLDGQRRRSKRYGEKKSLLPLPEIEPRFLECAARSLSAIPTELLVAFFQVFLQELCIHSSHMHSACPVQLILLYLTILILFEQYKLWSSLRYFLQPPIYFIPLRSIFALRHPVLRHPPSTFYP
jgi:hypothetical protein